MYNGTTASSCLFCSLWDFFHCLYLFSLMSCVSTGNIRCVATNQFAPQVWMTKYNNAPDRQAKKKKRCKKEVPCVFTRCGCSVQMSWQVVSVAIREREREMEGGWGATTVCCWLRCGGGGGGGGTPSHPHTMSAVIISWAVRCHTFICLHQLAGQCCCASRLSGANSHHGSGLICNEPSRRAVVPLLALQRFSSPCFV